MANWLAYILIGKLFIYLWQQIPLPEKMESNPIISKLHGCDLCAGVWIYSALALIMGVDILSLFGIQAYTIIKEGVTGGIISFVVHIFSLGWRDKFSPDIVIR